jgi:hypothetical protein
MGFPRYFPSLPSPYQLLPNPFPLPTPNISSPNQTDTVREDDEFEFEFEEEHICNAHRGHIAVPFPLH